MAGTGLIEYIRQVRMEMKRVTWPSRKETIISTVSVFVMVIMASTFLYLADQIIALAVRFVMGFGL
ncbi:MAG: preprotein translocase subunit SecE [Alphaproteobacteria bacterium]|nr:preprotein translocase subunit SecE [Alphaproteobacteria bacterium]